MPCDFEGRGAATDTTTLSSPATRLSVPRYVFGLACVFEERGAATDTTPLHLGATRSEGLTFRFRFVVLRVWAAATDITPLRLVATRSECSVVCFCRGF